MSEEDYAIRSAVPEGKIPCSRNGNLELADEANEETEEFS